MLTTAGASFPASVASPVYCYGSFRSDLGANLKWRFFFYFRNQATGVETPFTPNASLANVSLYGPQVILAPSQPTSAGLGIPLAAQGAAEVVFGATSDLLTLGTAAAGATGKVMDAGSRLQMPRLDQVLAPTAAVAMNSQKTTGQANGTAANEGATFDQIPVPASALPSSAIYPANKGASAKYALEDHQHLPADPNRAVNIYEDFERNGVPVTNTSLPGSGVFVTTDTAAVQQASSATEIGVLRMNTAAGTTTKFGATGAGGQDPYTLTSTNPTYYSAKIAVVTLQDGTRTFKYSAGLLSAILTQTSTDGVWFKYDATTDTHWICECRAASTSTTVVSTVTVNAGQFYHLEIFIFGGHAFFYIDGVAIADISTNIPTARLEHASGANKSAGAGIVSGDFDWVHVFQGYPAKRAAGNM
jgi:hypothetical protein